MKQENDRSREQGGGSKEQGADDKPQATFENLKAWQDALDLAARVYELFGNCRDFGFRDQIRSASVSGSSNIAEGYERASNTELIRFLFIAKASCGEVRSQAYLAQRVRLLPDQPALALIDQARTLSRRLQKFIDVRREKFA